MLGNWFNFAFKCGILQDVIAEICFFACWVILHAVLSLLKKN